MKCRRYFGLFAVIGYLLLALMGVLIVGCETAPTPEKCAQYVAIYRTWEATAVERELSREEAVAMAMAGTYLELQCGWVRAKSGPGDLPRWFPPDG